MCPSRPWRSAQHLDLGHEKTDPFRTRSDPALENPIVRPEVALTRGRAPGISFTPDPNVTAGTVIPSPSARARPTGVLIG